MQFQTQIFVKVKNNGARLAKLGGYLFAASLLIVGALTVTKAADAYLNYDY